jgi:hypothetical protein
MIDPNQEEEFLREERSAIGSYVQNFTLTPNEVREYKKLAKKLAELVSIKTKIDVLELEKASLSFQKELMTIVGGDGKKLKEQWSKKHEQYRKENKKYLQTKQSYLA